MTATNRIISTLLIIVCLTILLWLPVFRNTEGFLDPSVCLLFSVSGALFILLLGWKTPMYRPAKWFALVILGQGISLQLIDAGPTIHYQHYSPINGVSSGREVILLVLLAFQGSIVICSLRKHLGKIINWIVGRLGLVRSIILLTAFVVVGAFPSRVLPEYGIELVLSGLVALIQLGSLIMGIIAIPQSYYSKWGEWINQVLNEPDNRRGFFGINFDRLAIGCAVWTTTVATLLVVFSYDMHPHVPDEVAYIYQAKYFSEGSLSVPAPPVPEATEVYLIDCDQQRCISTVPPGWPAMLAVGEKLGLPWMVNPVLAGINVLLLFSLLSNLYDRRMSRLGVLLVAASPWYLLISMSFMTHTFSLTCALVSALSVVKMYQGKTFLWGVLAGLAIGILSLNRPLEGVMVAVVLGLATLFIPGKRFRLGPVMILGISTLSIAVLVFPYNEAMTGDPFKFPIMEYADKVLGPGVNSLGFGADKGISWGGLDPFPGHGLPDVVVNAMLNIVAMNIEMFGWSVGSLLLIIFMLLSRTPGRYINADKWMLFFLFIIFAMQSLYWFSGGPDFGARYYYLAVIPLIALTVQAVSWLGKTISDSEQFSCDGSVLVIVGIFILSFSAMVNFLPWRAIDKYHNYRGMRSDIRNLIDENNFGRSLILINGKSHPDLDSAIIYSTIDPYANGPVIVWNRNSEVKKSLLKAYPDRKVWVVDGPSITGSGYKLATIVK